MYCGNENVNKISHGCWGDPELEYEGFLFNEWDVLDALEDMHCEYYGTHLDDDPNEEQFICDNVESVLYDYLWSIEEFDIAWMKRYAPLHYESLRWVEDIYDNLIHLYDSDMIDRYDGITFVVSDFVS